VKGCLFIVVLAAALVVGLVWFALPPAAGWAIEAAIPRDALRGTVHATVGVDFPPELLTGHADTVRLQSVDGVDAAGGTLEAAALDVTLRDVHLFDRTAARVDGNMTGVRVIYDGLPIITVRRIDVAGPTDAIVTTLSIDAAEARRRAVVLLTAELGHPPDRLTLVAPDRIEAVINGVSVAGRLVVQDGALVAVGDKPLPTLQVIPASATGPLTLQSVTIRPDALVVTGTLAPSALGIAGP
jgi:hypothetical protein